MIELTVKHPMIIPPPATDWIEGASPITHQTSSTPNTVSIGSIKLTSGAGIYRGASISKVNDNVSRTDNRMMSPNASGLITTVWANGSETNAVTSPESAIEGVMSYLRAARVATKVAARNMEVIAARASPNRLFL